MCKSGNPSTVQNANQSQSSVGGQFQTSSSTLGPTPETLALYQALLGQAQNVANQPFDPNTLTQYAPWTDALNQAVNYQTALGQQGMGFVPQAAGMIGQGGASTIGQIPGVAASLLSPWAGQAVDFGMSQGQAIGDWATGQAQNIQSQGPQLTPFSEQAVMQYYSPYQQNVVDATQNWFNNQNAIQSSSLLGQGIRQGNAFGGDRAGVAQGVLAGQQQLAQAPVIAGLYNQGYAQALQEFNQQNQLAAQLQEFGANLGLQGLTAQGQLGLGGLGMGLNAAGQANAQAIGALGQNQNAALQAGGLFGNLGATQFGQNLAGGQQAIQAGGIYPQYLQGLYNLSAQNAQALQAYPFQTTSWYGGLLGGLGPLTGSQQAAISNLLSNQQVNQIGQQTTTPPQANQWIQAAGLGLAGLGLFLKDGGSVPRLQRGGGISSSPYGAEGPPYAQGRGYVPSPNIRIGKLVAPDLPTRINQQNKENLLRSMFSNPSTSSGSSGSGTSSSNALTGLAALLSSPSAKKVAGSLSSLGADTTGVSVGDSGDVGPAEALRRGGLVGRYQDGGFDDEDEAPYEPEGFSVPDTNEDDSIPETAAYTAGTEEPPSWLGPQTVAGLGAEEAGLGGGALLPRPRPAEAGPPAVPVVSAGFDEGPTGGGGGGRWLQPIPGMGQRRRPGIGDLLTNIGIGLMARPGYGRNLDLSGVGAGLAAFRQQRLADEALDRKHVVDNSGETQRIRFADGRIWDTGLPTEKALARMQRTTRQAPRAESFTDPETGEKHYFDRDPVTGERVPINPVTGKPLEAAPAAPSQITSDVVAQSREENPPQTDHDKTGLGFAFTIVEKGQTIQTPLTESQLAIIRRSGASPAGTDFNAIRYALGDTSVLLALTGPQGGKMRGLIRDRAAQWYIDQGMSPAEANKALAEFGATKRGAQAIGQLEGRMTSALEKAAQVAPVVVQWSDKIPRTQFPLLNRAYLAAMKQSGNTDVVNYGIAIETLASNYGTALGMGNSVLTDFQTKRAMSLLEHAYSQGQMRAAVDQIMTEIGREQAGVKKSMDVYLGRQPSSAESWKSGAPTQAPGPKLPPPDQLKNGEVYDLGDGRKGTWDARRRGFILQQGM